MTYKRVAHTKYVQPLQEAMALKYGIGICAKVLSREGLVLLINRSHNETNPGIWEMPGGSIEVGESLEEALRREINEETSLTVEAIENYLGYFDFHNKETGKTNRKFCFAVKVSGTVCLSFEHTAYKWHSLPDITQLRVQGKCADYTIWGEHYQMICC